MFRGGSQIRQRPQTIQGTIVPCDIALMLLVVIGPSFATVSVTVLFLDQLERRDTDYAVGLVKACNDHMTGSAVAAMTCRLDRYLLQ